MVPHTGFEPVISALRGRCPGPLDECGAAGRPAWRDVAAGRDDSSDRLAGNAQASRRHRAVGPELQPVRLQERPDRVGDLLVALLADDQAVVRMRAERLVLGAEPVGQPLARRTPGPAGRARRR